MKSLTNAKTGPKEYFIKIENQDLLVGRITLIPIKDYFNVEIDLVLKESMKIWCQVDVLYQQKEAQEGLSSGVQRLATYLSEQRKKL